MAKNCFVELLDLGKRKFLRQEFEANRFVANFALQSPDGLFQDLSMIKG